ncbi:MULTISPECIES: hypothetical protein [Paenibacillus]|uniref:Uncharacterized protein n=1 Tax=Paenibacillus xylanilyticus TaxID=248903 RepID=A0A7Y6C2D9_9BACL|nr:hypothetical protein [Paenibacillus xylanilyticus]NUU78828.1 hypothetical protein [Paenibacillus xylanilyticus]
MRKVTSILLSFSLFLMLSIPVYAESSNDSALTKHFGTYMPIKQFDEVYGNKNSVSHVNDLKSSGASLSLGDIIIDQDNISFNAKIEYNNSTKLLNAEGNLRSSYKQEEGINSVIGEMVDQSNDFDILLFEIYNDNHLTKNLVNKDLETQPHVKLYLTDRESNILLFEFKIPESLLNIETNNLTPSDAQHDLFWFVSVVSPTEQKEIPVDETMLNIIAENEKSLVSPSAVGSFTDWVHPTTYTNTYYVAGDEIKNFSLPYGSWKSLNVTPSSTWINSFKIAEHVTVNGKTTNAQNLFTYKNVKLTTGVGAYSSIDRSFIDGSMVGKGSGSALAMKIAETLWSKINVVGLPSLSNIKSWITASNQALTSKNVTLGSTNVRLNTSPAAISGISSDSYTLHKNTGSNTGHYLTLQSDVQFNGNSGQSSSAANGVMYVSWDVYFNGSKYNSGEKTLEFQYRVNN